MCVIPNEKYGTLIPLDEWIESVHISAYVPDDGQGYWANETHHISDPERNVFDFRDIPKTATHVLWFNK